MNVSNADFLEGQFLMTVMGELCFVSTFLFFFSSIFLVGALVCSDICVHVLCFSLSLIHIRTWNWQISESNLVSHPLGSSLLIVSVHT